MSFWRKSGARFVNFGVAALVAALGLLDRPAQALYDVAAASAEFILYPRQKVWTIYSPRPSWAVPVPVRGLVDEMRRSGIETFQLSPSLMDHNSPLRQQIVREAWPIRLSMGSSTRIFGPQDAAVGPASGGCAIIFQHSGIRLVDCRPDSAAS
jgi:hypothetical protein